MSAQRKFSAEDRIGLQGSPCTRCHGLGYAVYASTTTWRGGIGGAAMTSDVCSKCWGSGSTDPWPSHKEFEKMQKMIEAMT